jgi:ATP-binding cassette subfamily B protein RaxB
MSFLNELSPGFGSKLPVILQTEATECGLACLAMVAGFHHYHTDLMTLRRRFPISLKGATLSDVMHIAQQLDLGTRPLKLDLEDLSQLKLPCAALELQPFRRAQGGERQDGAHPRPSGRFAYAFME